PVDARTVDGAVDVDLAGAAGDGVQEERVEVAAGLGGQQLQDAVGPVRGDPAEEPRERLPVEVERFAREVDDARDQEAEVEQPLDEALHELVEGLARLQVEEADQVDQQEREQERAQDPGRAWCRLGAAAETVEGVEEQEAAAREVGEEEVAAGAPLHLGERAAEGGGEEEERDEPALLRLGTNPRARGRDRRHSRLQSSSASSSTPVLRERRGRSPSP